MLGSEAIPWEQLIRQRVFGVIPVIVYSIGDPSNISIFVTPAAYD
jgi:hypothetical protein